MYSIMTKKTVVKKGKEFLIADVPLVEPQRTII
jgi:hypothetical protein